MRYCLVSLPLLLVIGCGGPTGEPTTDSQNRRTTTETSSPETSPATQPQATSSKQNNRPEVAADAFENVPDAIGTLTLATEAKFDEDRYQATEWLVMQGDAAVGPLAEEVADARTDTRSQIVIARILGRIGTSSAARELAKIANAENQLGAINAIQQLGVIEPSSTGIVNALIDLLQHQDERRRLEAVNALARIGPLAEAAGDKLIELQNSAENNALRQAARKTLEKVKPRKTLVD